MLNRFVKTSLMIACCLLVGMTAGKADTSMDGERLNLELQMQGRVEDALAKILSRDQFVVVVRVEPMAQFAAPKATGEEFQDGYYLPGVPTRRRFDGSTEALTRLTERIKPEREVYHRFIRRIAVTLVLDQDLPDDLVSKVRELTRQMISLDPARGDSLDVQRTAFQKPAVNPIRPETGVSKIQKGLREYWVLISLALILFCVTVFFLFIFGPLRGFLNRLIQVLPTLKPAEMTQRPGFGGLDAQILPALMAQTLGLPGPMPMGGAGSPNFSGSLQVENPNKRTTPFSFIREDNLSNLAVLLSHEAPDKAAVVLGYLPSEWISRVLSKLDPVFQTEITNQLATTRQLLPEQVEDIEQELRRRLDYMIGGPDRIYAVYDNLDQESQRRMLESLKISRPDITEELRKRTFFFEDLEKLESNGLKAILREVDLQTLVSALRGESESMVARIMEHLSEGKIEIVKQELEMGENRATRATLEAQRKICVIARRLVKDGQVHVVPVDVIVPAERFGGGLRATLKLPPGLALKESQKTPTEEGEVVPAGEEASIQDRIRRFMSRRHTDPRFPDAGTEK